MNERRFGNIPTKNTATENIPPKNIGASETTLQEKAPAEDNAPRGDGVHSIEELTAAWDKVKSRLKDELGNTVWSSWIRGLVFITKEGDVVTLGANTKMATNRVKSHYADRLRANFKLEWPEIDTVEIKHIRKSATVPERISQNHPQFDSAILNASATSIADGNFIDFGARIDPRMTFENFVVDKPNEFAHAVAEKTAETQDPQFNPLFIYGGVGLGKTHLMHAIATRTREKFAHRRVVYLTAEAFMHLFVKALRHKDTMQFKEQCRSVDVLMVDDVQFIGGKETTQEEFFHTFNALANENKQIIVSADKPPSELGGVEERLRSRLNWGLVANINPTTFELRMGIIQTKIEAAGITLSEQVIEFLAHKITSNVRELEGAINRIIANMVLTNSPVTVDTVRELLTDILRASNRQVSLDEIKRKVASHYKIRFEEMHSNRRSRNIVVPRQIAMYLAKNLTSNSYPEIGNNFGGRDHTTVMHAVNKVEGMIKENAEMAEDIAMLKALLHATH